MLYPGHEFAFFPILAIAPFVIPAAIEAGKSIFNYAFNRTPKFGDTAYGKRLKRRSMLGDIEPAERDLVLGNISKTAGNLAQTAKTNYRGRLQATGYGTSIAGEEGLKNIETQAIRPVSEASERIDLINIQSKKDAEDLYVQGQQGSDEARRQETSKFVGDLVGTGANAVIGGYKQKLLSNAMKDYDSGKFGTDEVIATQALFEKLRTLGIDDPVAWLKKNVFIPQGSQLTQYLDVGGK